MAILTVLVLCFAYVNCQTFPECDKKPSGTYLAVFRKNSGCRSFIYCDGENSFQGLCSLGLTFNPVKSSCDRRENVFCDEREDDNTIEMHSNDSPMKAAPIVFQKRSDSATAKQHPTPPGRTLRTELPSRNSNRPVPTRKPSKPPTKRSTLIASTTPRNTSKTSVLPPSRPTYKPSPSKPKTSAPTKTSSPVRTESPINIPTPPGGQNAPSQSKGPALPNLPAETEHPRLSTESDSYISTTKSHPNTKAPSTSTSKTITTKAFQTEILTSSTIRSEIAPSVQEECSKKTVGSFADPVDCRFYYRCMRGVLNKQECPKGFGWDPKSKMCTSKGCLK